MISIIVNDTELDLGTVSINLVLRSPMASGEGSYSFPFTFPASPKNKKVFQFANRIQKKDDIIKEYPSKIFFKGIPLFDGSLVVSETASKYFKAYFKSDSGKLYSDLKDLSLQAIDYKDPHTLSGDNYSEQVLDFSRCILSEYPAHDYVAFSGYYKNELINRWDWKNLHFDDTATPRRSKLQASLYLNTIIAALANHLSMNLSYNALQQHEELNKLVMWNNFCISRTDWPHINYSKLVPDYSCKSFLDDLGALFNVWPFINSNQKSLALRSFDDVLKSNNITDIPGIEKNSLIILPEDNKTYSLDFALQGSDDYYPTEIDINKVFGFVKAPDVMTENAISLGLAYETYTLQRVVNQHLWYMLPDDDSEPVPACADTTSFQPGEGDSIESKSVPPCNDRVVDPITFWYEGMPGHDPGEVTRNRWLLTPRADLQINLGMSQDLMSSRILFYRGLIKDVRDTTGFDPIPGALSPRSYPFASAGRYDMNGNSHGNYRLSFDGPDGLVENFWKQTMNWRANRKYVQFNKRYTAAELAALDFSEIRNTGDALILPEEIRITISTKGISKAKVKAWTV